jgi:hypothetical protein
MNVKVNQLKYAIPICLLTVLSGCERDPLDNYRREFTGTWEFMTVREDLSSGQPVTMDTVNYSGSIESLYSNRHDIILIRFTSTGGIDAIVSETGLISLPAYRLAGGFESLTGGFTAGGSRVEFSYTFSSGDYSLRSLVTGIRAD